MKQSDRQCPAQQTAQTNLCQECKVLFFLIVPHNLRKSLTREKTSKQKHHIPLEKNVSPDAKKPTAATYFSISNKVLCSQDCSTPDSELEPVPNTVRFC